MKIGIVLPAPPTYSETFFISQIIGLLKSGYNIYLFVNSNSQNDNGLPQNIIIIEQLNFHSWKNNIIVLLRLIIFYPFNLFRFIKLEKKTGYNLFTIIKHIFINAHILVQKLDWLHFGYATMGIYRENVARAICAKSAVSFRGFDIGLYPYQNPNCYDLLFKKIDKIHTISDDLYSKALSIGLDPLIAMQKITPGVNTSYFHPKLNNDQPLNNPLRLLTIGRLTWKKGYEYSLKALRLLKDQKIDFEYHIIGDGNYKESIIYAINQLDLNDNVILKGKLKPENVRSELKWADIYIQPSIQEGFCNAVLEAQAMGLISIVTNAEGLAENIKHGETGWVISKRMPEEIFHAIMEINSLNISQLEKIRKNAIKRVRNNFEINDYNHEWCSYYGKI